MKASSVSCPVSAPWFTPELKLLKAKGWHLEHLYKKTGFVVHQEMHNNHISRYKGGIAQTKSSYYSILTCTNDENIKSLFTLFNTIIKPPDSLPSHLYSVQICNSIKYMCSHTTSGNPSDINQLSHTFSVFQLPTDLNISDLISKSKSSTCPLPTVLVEAWRSSLLPFISAIFRSSLTSGIVPIAF